MIDRVAVLFLAGSALLGAVLLGELNAEDPGVQSAGTPAPAPAQTHPAQRLQSPRMDELLAATLSRPLFSATRRPSERAARSPGAPPRGRHSAAVPDPADAPAKSSRDPARPCAECSSQSGAADDPGETPTMRFSPGRGRPLPALVAVALLAVAGCEPKP